MHDVNHAHVMCSTLANARVVVIVVKNPKKSVDDEGIPSRNKGRVGGWDYISLLLL
jgi:hypothetical protein